MKDQARTTRVIVTRTACFNGAYLMSLLTSINTHRASKLVVSFLALGVIGLLSGCQSNAPTTDHAARTLSTHPPVDAAAQDMPAAAAESWQRLLAGNERFASGAAEHPDQAIQRIHQVAIGQHPFAIILGCSDSRVPPEIVFDTGLGDLFVVRVAGNTADAAAIGSIEYAAEHLGASLVVVLGHQRCGAVQAALSSIDDASKAPAPGHLDAFINPIVPAAKLARQTAGDDLLARATRENVRRVVDQLMHSDPILAESIRDKKLTIIGAVYNVDTGRVSPVPSQPKSTAP